MFTTSSYSQPVDTLTEMIQTKTLKAGDHSDNESNNGGIEKEQRKLGFGREDAMDRYVLGQVKAMG